MTNIQARYCVAVEREQKYREKIVFRLILLNITNSLDSDKFVDKVENPFELF